MGRSVRQKRTTTSQLISTEQQFLTIEEEEEQEQQRNSSGVCQQLQRHPLIEPTLRLSRKKINWIPKQLFQLSYIQNLYLNDNQLELLPEKFFDKLPQLSYVDLRNNQLQEIPTVGLKSHANLKILLLFKNALTQIPLELGFVKTLQALHWSENPLNEEQLDMLQQGTIGMKKKMRLLYKEQHSIELNK